MGKLIIKPLMFIVTNARMAVAKPGEYPHQVSLRTSSPDSPLPKHFCGASVIHPWLLLSAAHCFERIKPPNILAIPGDHSHSGSEKGEQPRNVTDLILHPKWDNQTWENDIAILVLDEPLEFDENVRPILLWDSNSGPLPGTKLKNLPVNLIIINFWKLFMYSNRNGQCDRLGKPQYLWNFT